MVISKQTNSILLTSSVYWHLSL